MGSRTNAVGMVWVILGILYVIAIFASGRDQTVIWVGAMIYALVAVTSSLWAPMLTGRDADRRR